jgi:hypothetical protein
VIHKSRILQREMWRFAIAAVVGMEMVAALAVIIWALTRLWGEWS